MSSPTYDALAATPLLAGLDPASLALLEAEGTVRKFAIGEIIVQEGEPGHSFYIIMEGDVEVVKRHGQPHPVLLARLHRGTFFGEMCVVDPVPRAATVSALTDVAAIEIRAATLHHLFRKMPAQYAIVILNLARDMARRLRLCDEAFAARAS
jgi:CRP/FNR family cyclic AMP-dependent transcriptional regulator